MEQIKFYGRGGQGIVTASKMMVSAVNYENNYSHSIPSFGQERKGAPVFTYARISDEPIDLRSFVYRCNAVIVFDYHIKDLGIDVSEGVEKDSFILVNTEINPEELIVSENFNKIACVDAFGITKDVIGSVPPNAVMLGALCKAAGWFEYDTLIRVIEEFMPGKKGKLNIEAAKRGFENVKIESR